MSLPDRLPLIEPGRHQRADGRMNAMEAAAWLAGEDWTDRPRSVHPVIARIGRAAEPRHETGESVWPLVLASLGTSRPRRPFHAWRLTRCARRHLAGERRDWRQAWEAVLALDARYPDKGWARGPLKPIASVAGRVRQLATSQRDTAWHGTLSYTNMLPPFPRAMQWTGAPRQSALGDG